jgi:gliding motility-associated-like protein
MSYFYIDGAATYDVSLDQEISNVFTPNNDGNNDYWFLPDLPGYNVTIYNRWGAQILSSEIINFRWDGKNKSSDTCSEGVYYYVISKKTLTLIL